MQVPTTMASIRSNGSRVIAIEVDQNQLGTILIEKVTPSGTKSCFTQRRTSVRRSLSYIAPPSVQTASPLREVS